ncbi:hypothetical protein, partial [Candidatus Cardinium hertigii]
SDSDSDSDCICHDWFLIFLFSNRKYYAFYKYTWHHTEPFFKLMLHKQLVIVLNSFHAGKDHKKAI